MSKQSNCQNNILMTLLSTCRPDILLYTLIYISRSQGGFPKYCYFHYMDETSEAQGEYMIV